MTQTFQVRPVLLFALGLATLDVAAQPTSPKPIATLEEVAAIAAEAPVMRSDFVLPVEKNPMDSEALAKHLFNEPESARWHRIVASDWRQKWDILSKALVESAEKQKLSSTTLACCLAQLNYGQNAQTRLRAFYIPPVTDLDKSADQLEAERITGEKKAAIDDEALRKNPRYDESLAAVPIAAYWAKYAKGECWIIVCAWEYARSDGRISMGHSRVWAMDIKTGEVVAYATCD